MYRVIPFALTAGVLLSQAGSPLSAADIVNRKSTETRVAGSVAEVSRTAITIKPLTGDNVEVPANDIETIEWDAGTAALKLAQSDENGGRFAKALEGYRKALSDVAADAGYLEAAIEYAIARTTAKIALADPARQDEAVELLEGFLSGHGDNYNYFNAQQMLGRVQMARGDFAAAQQAFDELARAPWSDYQMAAKTATARILMAQDNVAQAIATFEEVAAMPANLPQELSRRYEAMLGKARGLHLQGKNEEAVELLDAVISNASPQDAPLQADAYVLQGDCLQALNRMKEAVLAYLHVDVLYPQQTALHAKSLYELSRLWKVVQSPERAAEAQAKLETAYPNSDWTKKLSGG